MGPPLSLKHTDKSQQRTNWLAKLLVPRSPQNKHVFVPGAFHLLAPRFQFWAFLTIPAKKALLCHRKEERERTRERAREEAEITASYQITR